MSKLPWVIINTYKPIDPPSPGGSYAMIPESQAQAGYEGVAQALHLIESRNLRIKECKEETWTSIDQVLRRCIKNLKEFIGEENEPS